MSAFIREIGFSLPPPSLVSPPAPHSTPHSPTCSIPTYSGSLKSKECRIANYPGDAADTLWSPPLIALFLCSLCISLAPSLTCFPLILSTHKCCLQTLNCTRMRSHIFYNTFRWTITMTCMKWTEANRNPDPLNPFMHIMVWLNSHNSCCNCQHQKWKTI